jgi:hypothetical protein
MYDPHSRRRVTWPPSTSVPARPRSSYLTRNFLVAAASTPAAARPTVSMPGWTGGGGETAESDPESWPYEVERREDVWIELPLSAHAAPVEP